MINHAPVGDRVSGISARRTGLDGHGGDGERHESVIATCLHLVEQATDGLLWRLTDPSGFHHGSSLCGRVPSAPRMMPRSSKPVVVPMVGRTQHGSGNHNA